jgi:hypothetical protein
MWEMSKDERQLAEAVITHRDGEGLLRE